MPAFKYKVTESLLGPSKLARKISVQPDDELNDYTYYYVSMFADRDIFMRHHGGGIGHRGYGVDVETSRLHGLRVKRAGQHTRRARTINQAIDSLFALDSDSDSGLDEAEAPSAAEDHAAPGPSQPVQDRPAHTSSSSSEAAVPPIPLKDEPCPNPDVIALDALEGQTNKVDEDRDAAWEEENIDEDRPGRNFDDGEDSDSEDGDSDDEERPDEIEESAPLSEGEDDYEEDNDDVYAPVGFASL
ncbi:hypothetical protein C8Q76DRAFT_720354 [Earliella scabrosa]|nr:hypothetical protein C8Q76DRAFT_720354 [Earliella scabrosa]